MNNQFGPGNYEYIEINPKLLGEDMVDTEGINDDLPSPMFENVTTKRGSAVPTRQNSMIENFNFGTFSSNEPITNSSSTDALLRQILAKLDIIVNKIK